MAIYYIGAFPPAYGGVTIKNKNLYEALSSKLDIRKIDMSRIKRGQIKEVFRFGWAILTGSQYIIGLAGRKNRRQFTEFMYRFKRRAMRRSVLLVMVGIVDDVITAGPDFVQKFNTYAHTYVELPGMLKKLEAAGVRNVAVYPNGRPRPDKLAEPELGNGPLKCVFFSIIQPEKGVDLILQTAHKQASMQFHFYGEIEKTYEAAFMAAIRSMENVTFHGVFTGCADDVYRELSQYDVLLLPTRCKTEGLPGILIEAKIAGVPAIVSDQNFNSEIVQHNHDGMVIQNITSEALACVLEELNVDREKLLNMKIASRISAEQYYMDAYVQAFITDILER